MYFCSAGKGVVINWKNPFDYLPASKFSLPAKSSQSLFNGKASPKGSRCDWNQFKSEGVDTSFGNFPPFFPPLLSATSCPVASHWGATSSLIPGDNSQDCVYWKFRPLFLACQENSDEVLGFLAAELCLLSPCKLFALSKEFFIAKTSLPKEGSRVSGAGATHTRMYSGSGFLAMVPLTLCHLDEINTALTTTSPHRWLNGGGH